MHQDENPDRRRTPERDRSVPNRAANMEQAEGSRETARGAGGSEVPPAAFGEGGGISNRPASEEQERQERLPERGGRRDERKEGERTDEDMER